MVNEGYRRLYVRNVGNITDIVLILRRFVGVFVALHAMIFAFGFVNYDLKACYLQSGQWQAG